ncbi:hypothetical protein Tco_0677503 [Tanacetum coccineum]|uniref:BZIP domain-containing protein n=1 Tax=Tanacetum coccineum TaxID=301880 RepID=A0ABQ4XCJ5_9ASTR
MLTQQDINAIRAQRSANTHDPLALMHTQTLFHPDHSSLITYIQHPQPNNNFVQQHSFNTNYMQQPMQNPKDISDPTTALDMALELIQIAQSGMNIDQDRHMLMVDDNVGNRFRENAVQNVGYLDGQHAVQNLGTQNVGNQNGHSVVQGIANQHGNRNIALKEEAGIQLTQEEFDFMAAAGAYEEIKRVNANFTLKDNLQQASTSGTQTDKAPVYDSDESAELLEPIPESHQVPQNDSNVISEVSSVEQSGGIVEQHLATPEETRALYDSLYNILSTEVKKVNSVNRKLRETNADLTTELARYKNQEKKRKRLKSDFKIREDELLDKQIQLENMIKELDNILVKTGQSIQMMHMLSPKPDSFYHTEQKMALGYQNPFYLKQAQQKQQSLYNGKVLLEKHDPPVVGRSLLLCDGNCYERPRSSVTFIQFLGPVWGDIVTDWLSELKVIENQLFPSTSVVAPETSTIAPVISSAAHVVETTLVASPTGLCGLVPYTGSDSDSPDEVSSPEHISPLPAISPFICTDSSEAPDSSDGPPSQDPYVAIVAR